MEKNEIMNVEVMEDSVVAEALVADGGKSLGTGMAMAIGAGLALVASVGVKAVAKLIRNRKAKKEARLAEDAVDYVDVDEIEA